MREIGAICRHKIHYQLSFFVYFNQTIKTEISSSTSLINLLPQNNRYLIQTLLR